MPVTVQVLNDLASTLRISPPTPAQPAAGQLVTAGLVPAIEDLQFTDPLEGALSLTFITKNVLFKTAAPEPAGLLPIDLASQIVGGVPLGGLTSSTDVPGLLGQVAGTVPLTSLTRIPVSVDVTWSVRTDPDPAKGEELKEQSDFLAPSGLSGPAVSLLMLPQVAELTTDHALPAPQVRYLHAKVRLSAGGVTMDDSVPVQPAVPLLVPVLALPTVLALFLHTDFAARQGDDDGAVLLVVPTNSPFGSLQQLQPTLDQLQAAASGLSGVASFAAFLAGISELTGAVTAQPYAQFRSADSISSLNDITLIQRDFYENDTEAEDELSSLIFMGPEGKRADFFNARDLHDDEGAFGVTVGGTFVAMIRNLHTSTPTVEGGTFNQMKDASFGDSLSSLRFD